MKSLIWNNKKKCPDLLKEVVGISGTVYGSSIFKNPDETWCYIEDLMKQDKKAEKLEKQNELLKEALSIAMGALDFYSKEKHIKKYVFKMEELNIINGAFVLPSEIVEDGTKASEAQEKIQKILEG